MNKKERSEKAIETKRLKREGFQNQTIEIDDNWRILRADELNWEVQFKRIGTGWQFEGYYCTLLGAFSSLLDKMLGEEARSTLADIQERQKAILAKIEEAIP